MLYSSELLGDSGSPFVIQLACAALAVHMTLTSLLGPGERGFPAVIAMLAVATPLSFFVCFT